MRLRVGAATNKGRVREINEDVYVLRAAQGLFVVCDGMGGGPDGEVASRIAAETIVQHLDGCLRPGRNGDEDRDGGLSAVEGLLPRTTRLVEAVRFSNGVIYRHGHDDPRCAGMGTTVVGAWLEDHVASVAHVGDSRGYMWHDGRLQPLTRDHSLVEALVGDGLIASGDHLAASQQNVLLRVLGGQPDVEVDVREVPVQPGDYLLLCSDGLTRMVSESALCEAIGRIRHPQRICDHLVDAANRNGGTDNITVVVVQVVDGWRRRLTSLWKRRVGNIFDVERHSEIDQRAGE
jgi:protein phosphatase